MGSGSESPAQCRGFHTSTVPDPEPNCKQAVHAKKEGGEN